MKLKSGVQHAHKIGIVSLGCPRNLVDSEGILGRLVRKGYSIVDIEDADIAIVNTCTFIDDAKRESIDVILDLIDLKKEGRLKKIILYGCMVERYKEKLSEELPGIDAFVGRVSLNHDDGRARITPAHFAYLKISEGCIHRCSYCVIPQIKGKFTSLDMDSVCSKARLLDKSGVSELNIIGQDTSGYGLDLYGKRRLPELVRRILKSAPHIGWIRLLYLYPDAVVDELLDVMKDEPRICRYIDLPLQHINSRILKLMNRRTSKKSILGLIGRLRTKLPDVAIRTSLIVGFPSETDEEFKELLDFVERVRFERLGVFMYSREEATPAAAMKEQVPESIKRERFGALMARQQVLSVLQNKKFLGRIIPALIDEACESSGTSGSGRPNRTPRGRVETKTYVGRTQSDAPEVDGVVYVHSRLALKPGDFVNIKITDTLEYDLVGDIC